MKRLLVALLLVMASAAAQAHKPSDSYLSFKSEPGHVTGQWDIALRDLEYAIGLDADGCRYRQATQRACCRRPTIWSTGTATVLMR